MQVPAADSDSGEDGGGDQLAPSEAYKQLLSMLSSDAPAKILSAPKRKREARASHSKSFKTNGGTAVRTPAGKKSIKALESTHAAAPNENGGSAKGKPEKQAEQAKPGRRKGTKVVEEPDSIEPSKSMKAHIER